MNKILIVVVFVLLTLSCAEKDKYDVSRYYDLKEQDEVMTSIIAYVFSAPTYVSMKDRLKPEHRKYYSSLTSKFSFVKYYIADDGTHYFYILRPAPNINEKRAVGGHFKMTDDFTITEFREEFVTPVLPVSDLLGRCAFLFDEMIKGDLSKYLAMESYVQWPSPITYYDTITYEWKLKPGYEEAK